MLRPAAARLSCHRSMHRIHTTTVFVRVKWEVVRNGRHGFGGFDQGEKAHACERETRISTCNGHTAWRSDRFFFPVNLTLKASQNALFRLFFSGQMRRLWGARRYSSLFGKVSLVISLSYQGIQNGVSDAGESQDRRCGCKGWASE